MARHQVESEAAGIVCQLAVSVGDTVQEGEVLLYLESMKMQIPVEASKAGTVVEFLVQLEDSVDENQAVAVIEA
jgi:acetyl-CoA carboxylase biotin carboxyl carrier protein